MPEDKELEMELGEAEETVYDSAGRNELVEDDEIDPWEEGFMEGAEKDGQRGKCAYCGGALVDRENVYEKTVEGERRYYCSSEHAEKDETDLI